MRPAAAPRAALFVSRASPPPPLLLAAPPRLVMAASLSTNPTPPPDERPAGSAPDAFRPELDTKLWRLQAAVASGVSALLAPHAAMVTLYMTDHFREYS